MMMCSFAPWTSGFYFTMAWHFLEEMCARMNVPIWWKLLVWDTRYGLDGTSECRRLPSTKPSYLDVSWWYHRSGKWGDLHPAKKLKTSPLIKWCYVYTWVCLTKGLPEHRHEPEVLLQAKCRISLPRKGPCVASDPFFDLRSSKRVQMKGIYAPSKTLPGSIFFIYVRGRYLKKISHLLD